IINSSRPGASMTPEEEQQVREYSRAIAKILHKNTVTVQGVCLRRTTQHKRCSYLTIRSSKHKDPNLKK
ncbi:hypothetical protein, partial [Nostoc sp.]